MTTDQLLDVLTGIVAAEAKLVTPNSPLGHLVYLANSILQNRAANAAGTPAFQAVNLPPEPYTAEKFEEWANQQGQGKAKGKGRAR